MGNRKEIWYRDELLKETRRSEEIADIQVPEVVMERWIKSAVNVLAERQPDDPDSEHFHHHTSVYDLGDLVCSNEPELEARTEYYMIQASSVLLEELDKLHLVSYADHDDVTFVYLDGNKL